MQWNEGAASGCLIAMKLDRNGHWSNSYSVRHSGIRPYRDPISDDPYGLYYRFPHFGNGSTRTSDFDVAVTWSDVLSMVVEFVKLGHPEALKLTEDIAAIARVRDALKPQDAETNEAVAPST